MNILLKAALSASFGVAAAISSSSAEETIDDSVSMIWVWYPTAQCTEPLDGPGSTPNDAIKLDDFYDVYFEILDANDDEEDEQNASNYNCRFVQVTGYFRWTDYYDYRGYLNASPTEAYFGGESRFIIENFADKDTRRTNLNGAIVTVTGRFYDLCFQSATDQKASGQDWFIIGGPCHYGHLEGMMLRDVIIESVSSGPNLRIKGEENRALIGDLSEMSSDWPQYEIIESTFFDWIESLKSGREQHWHNSIYRSEYLDDAKKADRLKEALSDEDDWITFLTTSNSSPIKNKPVNRLRRLEFKVFENLDYRGGWNEGEEYRNVTACVCLKTTCKNEWPLFDADTSRFADQYLCNEITRGRDETNWQWSAQ